MGEGNDDAIRRMPTCSVGGSGGGYHVEEWGLADRGVGRGAAFGVNGSV